jgi:hypothetical protein
MIPIRHAHPSSRVCAKVFLDRTCGRRLREAAHVLLTEQAPTPAHIPCIVIAESDENNDEHYSVQVMTTPSQAGSFVTEVIRPGHTLYNFMLERVGALNLAGDFEQIDGIGENLSQRHYNVYINEEQHRTLCALGTTEQF